ncbi:hypothetical protein NDI56_03800 [Haloarcula sp. S1CR25-12]|uniref:Uncharacterized protein n=1 Tax=Haloarcula saliterrae TaxID=2950534 RepID=A0ABU2F8G7_9EURY|nr:hypothetical protein [Haloarcula sp. S1CR25-12]MDS0258534.1 hypothetical protein [Haloarcula sp. S1CR25-12]
MIAGTLFVLDDTADEPLETWFRNGRLPALDVHAHQQTFGDGTVQSGEAAASIVKEVDVPEVATVANKDTKSLITERREQNEKMHIDWVADVTGTGIILASSVEGTEFGDFPVGLFYSRTGQEPRAQYIDVEGLHTHWDDADELDTTWLNAAEDIDGEGSSIDYHDNARSSEPATIGLGFGRFWDGTVMRGVVYQSGYVALYNCDVASNAVQFVAEEILPHCYEDEDELGSGGDSDSCVRCGRDTDTNDDGHCIVCEDKLEEEAEEDDSQTTIEDLDTVTETGGESDGE